MNLMDMKNQLELIAKIIQSGSYNNARVRLIGNTSTVALELRGLSAADMAELAGNASTPSVQQEAAQEAAQGASETVQEPVESEELPKRGFFGGYASENGHE